jgi:hypothetical protein
MIKYLLCASSFAGFVCSATIGGAATLSLDFTGLVTDPRLFSNDPSLDNAPGAVSSNDLVTGSVEINYTPIDSGDAFGNEVKTTVSTTAQLRFTIESSNSTWRSTGEVEVQIANDIVFREVLDDEGAPAVDDSGQPVLQIADILSFSAGPRVAAGSNIRTTGSASSPAFDQSLSMNATFLDTAFNQNVPFLTSTELPSAEDALVPPADGSFLEEYLVTGLQLPFKGTGQISTSIFDGVGQDYTINFGITDYAVSLTGLPVSEGPSIERPPITTPETAVVLVDFRVEQDVAFGPLEIDPDAAATILGPVSGTQFIRLIDDPQALSSDLPDRQEILTAAQEIFWRSGIDVTVRDLSDVSAAELDEFDSTIRVVFAENAFSDGSRKSTWVGEAYDVQNEITATAGFLGLIQSPLEAPANTLLIRRGIDQFDTRKDGNVVVFVDNALENVPDYAGTPAQYFGNIIAHEAGHGFGAFHTEEDLSDPTDIMDYQIAASGERFIQTDAPIRIGDLSSTSDGDTVGAFSDVVKHNAAYHLRRYALGESEESLQVYEDGSFTSELLIPGNYDQPDGLARNQTAVLGTVQFGQDAVEGAIVDNVLRAIYLFTPEGDGSFGEGGFLRDITSLFEGNQFSFLIENGMEFSILGQSQSSTVIDTFFGVLKADGKLDTALTTEKMLSSEIGLFDFDDGGAVREIATISAQSFGQFRQVATGEFVSATPIPIGPGWAFLATSLCAIGFLRRVNRRSA